MSLQPADVAPVPKEPTAPAHHGTERPSSGPEDPRRPEQLPEPRPLPPPPGQPVAGP